LSPIGNKEKEIERRVDITEFMNQVHPVERQGRRKDVGKTRFGKRRGSGAGEEKPALGKGRQSVGISRPKGVIMGCDHNPHTQKQKYRGKRKTSMKGGKKRNSDNESVNRSGSRSREGAYWKKKKKSKLTQE